MKLIPRIAPPSQGEFDRRFVRPGLPVIVAGAIEEWPARHLWSVAYFRSRFGGRRVAVARTREGHLEFSPHSGTPKDELRFADFLDEWAADRPGRYLIAPARERLPELLEDIRVPPFCPPASWRHSRLWIGPSATVSPLHRDLPDNYLAQVIGRKRLLLFDARESDRMYAFPWYSQVPNFSRVDAEAPDLERYPRFAGAEAWEGEVGAGDLVYIPRRWWHQVRALEASVSVNVWWASGTSYALVLAALAAARLRGLRY